MKTRRCQRKTLLILIVVGGSVLTIIRLISYFLLIRQPPSFPPRFNSSLFSPFHSLNDTITTNSKPRDVTLRYDGPGVNSKTDGVKSKLSNSTLTSRLPACPSKPPNLVGFQKVKEMDQPMLLLEKKWRVMLREGGHYTPPDCLPKDRTAIIIPCRNRWPHLRILFKHLIPFLIRQQVAFTFFVIESDQASHFNKGILLNAAYLEALKYDNYTCFVFQDVDLLPLNDKNLYRCGPQPRHLAVAIDKNNFKLPYPRYFGGVLALSKEQIEKVNGHSNVYFGWGGEDDDIYYRVNAKGYKVFRMPVSLSQYHMIRHDRDKGNEETQQKAGLMTKKEVVKRMDEEGMRQAVYHKDWVNISPLFTWIHVTINETQVIQNLPLSIRDKFKEGLIMKHR